MNGHPSCGESPDRRRGLSFVRAPGGAAQPGGRPRHGAGCPAPAARAALLPLLPLLPLLAARGSAGFLPLAI